MSQTCEGRSLPRRTEDKSKTPSPSRIPIPSPSLQLRRSPKIRWFEIDSKGGHGFIGGQSYPSDDDDDEDEEEAAKKSDEELGQWEQPPTSPSWETARKKQRSREFYQAQIEVLHSRNAALERRISKLERRSDMLEDRSITLENWYRALQKSYLRMNKQIRAINPKAEERVIGLKQYCQIQQNFLAELMENPDVKRIVYANEDYLDTLNTWKHWRTLNKSFLEYEFDEAKEAQRREKSEEWQQAWKKEKQVFKADVRDLADEPPEEDTLL